MKFIVKAFNLDGKEIEFEKTVIEEGREVTFETLEAANAFIEGIKNQFTFYFSV